MNSDNVKFVVDILFEKAASDQALWSETIEQSIVNNKTFLTSACVADMISEFTLRTDINIKQVLNSRQVSTKLSRCFCNCISGLKAIA